MPGKAKKTVRQKTLPAHFGEIDITAPFDPNRFVTALRCSGADPYVWRYEGQTRYCLEFYELGIPHGPSEMHRRSFHDAHTWANAQDKDQKILNEFFREIVRSKPDGDFIHHLG
jgi:hypothetical protein